jgi:photosystem II stability/assembly factor-like uncharacterized protein
MIGRAAGLLGLLAAGLAASLAASSPRHAQPSPLATASLLVDVARTGGRLVAVGERGHVVLSDDGGETWRQSGSVPVQTTLTEVFFVDDRRGWAVGHDALVLHTADAGETWQLQHSAPEHEAPLLSVWFEDARRGLAVGAFGLMLETRDGGRSWEQRRLGGEEPPGAEDEGPPEDPHLNHLFPGPGGALFIAAEFGVVYRSRDRGSSWERLQSPYTGSFWGGLGLADGALLVFGMRGHVLRSEDQGDSWREVPSSTDQSLQDGTRLSDGRLVLVGLGGTVLESSDGGRSFSAQTRAARRGIASVAEGAGGRLLFFGEAGVDAGEQGG